MQAKITNWDDTKMSTVTEGDSWYWYYESPDYSFRLVDEKYHSYETLILAPKHIKLMRVATALRNSISTQELLETIVDDWFGAENEWTRNRNNAKRRAAARSKDV